MSRQNEVIINNVILFMMTFTLTNQIYFLYPFKDSLKSDLFIFLLLNKAIFWIKIIVVGSVNTYYA